MFFFFKAVFLVKFLKVFEFAVIIFLPRRKCKVLGLMVFDPSHCQNKELLCESVRGSLLEVVFGDAGLLQMPTMQKIRFLSLHWAIQK
jgi:hypothetical protein